MYGVSFGPDLLAVNLSAWCCELLGPVHAMVIDPLLSVTLRDFEISVPPDIFHRNRSTLLVGNIEDHDEFRILGYLIKSPFGNLDNLDDLGFYDFQYTDQRILVECDREMKEILKASPKVLLFDFTITAG